jgi:hypothetical protein
MKKQHVIIHSLCSLLLLKLVYYYWSSIGSRTKRLVFSRPDLCLRRCCICVLCGVCCVACVLCVCCVCVSCVLSRSVSLAYIHSKHAKHARSLPLAHACSVFGSLSLHVSLVCLIWIHLAIYVSTSPSICLPRKISLIDWSIYTIYVYPFTYLFVSGLLVPCFVVGLNTIPVLCMCSLSL